MTEDEQTEPKGTFSRLMQDDENSERPNEPSNERSSGRTNDDPNEQPDEPTSEPSNDRTAPTHQIVIPVQREKLRWSFDVFRDQRAALGTLQFAATEKGEKREPLGTMVQQALDAYIKQEAKRLGNVEVKREASG